MKLLIKLVFLTNIIGLAGMVVFHTQAASFKNHHPLIQQETPVMVFFTLPQLHSEGSHLISIISENSQHFNSARNSSPENTCPSNKTNEMYELTTLFNDKLQILLSYFSTQENRMNMEDKREDKEAIKVLSVKTS